MNRNLSFALLIITAVIAVAAFIYSLSQVKALKPSNKASQQEQKASGSSKQVKDRYIPENPPNIKPLPPRKTSPK